MHGVLHQSSGCIVSSPHVAKAPDPLATLRINRGAPRRGSGWFGKLVMLLFVAGLAAGGYWAWNKYGEELTRPQVKTALAQVQSADAADSILSAQGYLKSEKQAAIGAKAPGRVLKIFVREGQPVEPGQVVSELEHADIDQTLEAMQASIHARDASVEAMKLMLEKARAELIEVESNLALDENELTRAEKLLKQGITTQSAFQSAEAKAKASRSKRDSMKAAVAVGQSRLIESEAQQRESHARFREAEQQRENLIVRAPFKGIVISKEAEEGESIMPGGMGAASGRGSVVTLADLLHLEVDTDVKEDYVSRVKKEQPVSVAVDAVPDRRFSGVVRTIIPMGDRAKGTVKVKVRLNPEEVAAVNDPQTETFTLFPEMAATVYFLGAGKQAARGTVEPKVFAPAGAIQTDSDGPFVWKIVDDRVTRAAVDPGELKDGRTQIKSGLKAGERIVVDPPADLQDGRRVRVQP